jgi:membrane protein implicated in regulation of membrane protease activity
VLPRNDGPSALAWLIAFVSLVLPWAGLAAGLVGAWQIAQGDRSGWWLVGAGAAMLIADVVIDFVWAHPSISKSDQPDLNRRAEQLIGRVLLLEEAIEGGRGKVRVGDTLWLAEGAELPAGTRVKVTGVRRDALQVEVV